jgi:hypothetical protein
MPDGRTEQRIGKYYRFGEIGPVYKILGVARELSDGDTMLRVLLVETGEEAQYRLSHALEDPEAA